MAGWILCVGSLVIGAAGWRVIRSPSCLLVLIGAVMSIGPLGGSVDAGDGAGHACGAWLPVPFRSVAWKIVLQFARLPPLAWTCQCAERAMHRYVSGSPRTAPGAAPPLARRAAAASRRAGRGPRPQ